MRPCWQHDAVALTLRYTACRPAIDLKIVTEIPAEIRRPIDGEAAGPEVTRPEVTGPRLRNSDQENCAAKRQRQNNIPCEGVF